MSWLDELDDVIDPLGDAPLDQTDDNPEAPILIIDGDVIAYRSAFACQESKIIAVSKDGIESVFANKTAAKEKLGDSLSEHTLIAQINALPETALSASIASQISGYKRKFKTDRVEIYLNDSGNFRYDIPLPSRYKSTRTGEPPVHLKRAIAILRENYFAESMDELEADDAISIRQHKLNKEGTPNIVVTVDKDAMQCEGVVYNPSNSRKTTVDRFGSVKLKNVDGTKKIVGTGLMWLLAQVLMGDKIDGYAPSHMHGKKIGPVAVYNILNGATCPEDAWQRVFDAYAGWFGTEPIAWLAHTGEFHGGDYVDVLQMYVNCAFMVRNGNLLDVREILGYLERGENIPNCGLGVAGE